MADPREDTSVGNDVLDVLGGRYRLVEQIGSGGAGTVWRAVDSALDRHVAVKLLHRELERDDATVARFRREATAAAALAHPNAVVIYDIGDEGGRIYLVMELVSGPTLADVLASGPLPPDAVAAIGSDISQALGDAHARGLVHRDIKPANILLTSDGAAKVADFGIAQALGGAQASLTRPGTVVGTAAYLAPEQLEGGPVDARADVYALGLMLHECLTGRPPFEGGTALEVASRRLTTEVVAPRSVMAGVPAALDTVVVRATRREPTARYADGAAMAAALDPLVPAEAAASTIGLLGRPGQPTGRAGGGTAALPPVGATTTNRPPAADDAPATPVEARGEHRARRGLIGAGAVGIVGVALVAAMLTGGDEPQGGGDSQQSSDGGGNATTVEAVDAADYDPFGDDGEEHADEVGAAIDGDGASAWTTEGYSSADLGGLKPGVGIWFDLEDPQQLQAVELALTVGGSDVEIYTSETDPSGGDFDVWGDSVGTTSDAGAEVTIEVDQGQGRYWLVWFTSLGADGGRHRGGISDVRFLP